MQPPNSFLSKKIRALCICPKLQCFEKRLLQPAKFCGLGSDQLPKGTLPQSVWPGGGTARGARGVKGEHRSIPTSHVLLLLKHVHKSVDLYEIKP